MALVLDYFAELGHQFSRSGGSATSYELDRLVIALFLLGLIALLLALNCCVGCSLGLAVAAALGRGGPRCAAWAPGQERLAGYKLRLE